MTIKVATIAQVKTEAIRLAQGDPTFVYTEQEGGISECGYGGMSFDTTQGRPCIIGQALINLGADREELSKVSGGVKECVHEFFTDGNPLDSNAARDLSFLNILQCMQDMSKSWGDALASAMSIG